MVCQATRVLLSGTTSSLSLGARGAGPHTDARSAQAAATRLLAARGARVEGWYDGGHGALAMFRPTLDPSGARTQRARREGIPEELNSTAPGCRGVDTRGEPRVVEPSTTAKGL